VLTRRTAFLVATGGTTRRRIRESGMSLRLLKFSGGSVDDYAI